MKDPKDQKKFESSSPESLLSAEYVDTPYGRVCRKMEVLCLACRKGEVIVVPDEVIKQIDNEDVTGSAFAEYYAEKKGWIVKLIQRASGVPALFMLCPQCVENLFKKFK